MFGALERKAFGRLGNQMPITYLMRLGDFVAKSVVLVRKYLREVA
jgi:hypothetical protein